MKIKNNTWPKATLFLSALFLLFFTSCKKEYSLESGNSQLASGNWQFTEGGSNFAGDIDTAYIQEGGTVNELHLLGTSNDGLQHFHLVMYADTFVVGTYQASAYQSSFQYGTETPFLYNADQLSGEFTVKITSINKSLVTGIFSGQAVKNGTDTVNITDGIFKAVFKNDSQEPTSSGTLGDENGNCMPVTLNGTYKQGKVMSPANTLSVQVNVAVPGTYYLFTELVNGINFSATGTFSQAGMQTVTLNAAGIPDDKGEKEFVVHFGNSQCAFKVNFEEGTAPSGDYYPVSDDSHWTYNDGIDTYFTKVIPGNKTVNGKTYKILGIYDELTDPSPSDTFSIVRKDAGNYYDLTDYSLYTQSSEPYRVETIFLKDNVAQGTSWDGPEFSMVVNGTTIKYHVKFTITAKAVPASLGGFDFPDVIKVSEQLYSGSTYLGIQGEKWYARNVGLVYAKDDINGTVNIVNYEIH